MLIKLDEIFQNYDISVKGILHVGAHAAEESVDYQRFGINRVVWVEANPSMMLRLMETTAHLVGNSYHWFAAHETDNTIVELNIASNGESSSILDFDTHLTEHPHVKMVDKIKVPTRRMDTFMLASGYDPDCFNFLNLDIQGAELIALKGMTGILDNIQYVYTEINEKSLYAGCCLTPELDEFLAEHGFKRYATHMTPFGWGDAFYAKEGTTSWPIIDRLE